MSEERKIELINIVRKQNIGTKRSNLEKENMSLSRKGRKTWNKGIPHSMETKEKIRKSINNPKTIKANIIKNISNKYEIKQLNNNKIYKCYSLSIFCKTLNINYSSLKKVASRGGVYKNYIMIKKLALDKTDLDLIKSQDDSLVKILECQ